MRRPYARCCSRGCRSIYLRSHDGRENREKKNREKKREKREGRRNSGSMKDSDNASGSAMSRSSSCSSSSSSKKKEKEKEKENENERDREKEKEKTKLRERKRRAITRNILKGLRMHGAYNLPPRADINDVLRALAAEAGWLVLSDGTTFRQNCNHNQRGVPVEVAMAEQIRGGGGLVLSSSASAVSASAFLTSSVSGEGNCSRDHVFADLFDAAAAAAAAASACVPLGIARQLSPSDLGYVGYVNNDDAAAAALVFEEEGRACNNTSPLESPPLRHAGPA